MLPVLCETGLVDDSEGAISNNFLSLVGFWSRLIRFLGHDATWDAGAVHGGANPLVVCSG